MRETEDKRGGGGGEVEKKGKGEKRNANPSLITVEIIKSGKLGSVFGMQRP